MAQFPLNTIDSLPLVALLCLASVVFLAFCLRKLFASRVREDPLPESSAIMPLIELQRSLDTLDVGREAATTIDNIVQTWSDPGTALTDQAYLESAEDQRFGAVALAGSRVPQPADVREALRARIARDRTSAQGLSDLVRALYLDQSNFRFEAIAHLDPEDRTLACALIETWMTDPSAIEFWESVYSGVCAVPDDLKVDRA